jgi:hypothetical protein
MGNVPAWGSPLGSTDWGWQQLDEESQVSRAGWQLMHEAKHLNYCAST